MTKSFADRVIGKFVESIEIGKNGYGIAIVFSDGAGIRVHTEVTASLWAGEAIDRITITDEWVTLHLGSNGLIAIAVDRERFSDVVELFIYHDEEGFIVEN
jgi:hypothetical protein